ncbi:MAG TPA: inorganic phosphate transporter [Chitinophagales bacterium]|nr:inorganic phosphate transporter [Chitinophagales bacterium]
MSTFLIVIIILAIGFDFINGFHDSANSIATIVSTRVLTPFQAVIWAAFFNFVAFKILPAHKVAATVGGIGKHEIVTLTVIAGGLGGAIIWNLFTWWRGIPTSSSHALMGGFAGAAIFKAGIGAINLDKITITLVFIPLAPIVGMIAAFIISNVVINICKNMSYSKVDKYFRGLQLLSSALYSIGHGANDAQKSMGLIWIALIITGNADKNGEMPNWVALACYTAMGMGTLLGGWRIVKTMGQRITKLRPFEGFCAETAGAATLFSTAALGIPVSTTHTITGSIMGAGMTKGLNAVKWGVAGELVVAWILTIPASAIMGGLFYFVLKLFIGG